MGLPLLGATLAGNKTDESDYLPTWRQLAKIIGHKDFLFLADSKGSTWKNRASINHVGGIYCFPLAMCQPRPKLLLEWVALPPTTVSEIYLNSETESESPIGQGFEVPLGSLWWDKEKQHTNHPTTEKLLAAFSDLTLYLYPDGSIELSSLNSLQRQILLLMKIPESIYLVPQLVPN